VPLREPPTQISRNLGQFWSHGNFLVKTQVFSPYAHWELQMTNGLHFLIQHEKSRLLVLGKEIWA